MSTYYEYQDVGVMIAHKLMAMDGWEVFGYHADHSDMMTDYYDPAYWGGIATKNGYTLVVNRSSEAKPEEIRKYNYDGTLQDRSISEKIAKLEQMTMERGASEQEEESARKMIEKLRSKVSEASEKYIVTGIIPGHMANPPRMNWHIEKDGVYVAKGNGILKFAHIDNYYRYESYMKDMQNFRTTKREEYRNSLISEYMRRWNDTEERAAEQADSHIESMEKDKALMDQFETFINKIDTTCGGMLGEGDGTVYEKVKVTEYKKENKAIETENGCVKDGQCFILKSSFNYGRNKGYVYRIKATVYEDGKTSYYAYKLNGKLTKECTGNANQANHWFIGTMTDGFMKWVNKGAIAWCEIQEVKTPYEVEKVVKKVIKPDTNKTEEKATETDVDVNKYTYEVTEDTDTRTGEKIYLAKVIEKLSREEYIKVNQYIKSIGGYYSKFKHAFLFKANPCEKLNATIKETENNTVDDITDQTEIQITYTVTEDVHTKTGEKLFVVKPDTELSKSDFANVKRKLASLQGFYSGFKKGFIFKYDPTEKLSAV
jgi:hypothetical protein